MNIRKGDIICLTVIISLLVGIIAFNSIPVNAKSRTNKQIVQDYCHKHYKGYKVTYFTKWNDEIMSHRTDKRIVYVQIEKSISSGKKDSVNGRYWGYVKGQHFYKTWYNKKVKKGKEVKSYYIFNPYTNYEDDIVAVVDNKQIR